MRQKQTALGLTLIASISVSSLASAAESKARHLAQSESNDRSIPQESVQPAPSTNSTNLPNSGKSVPVPQPSSGQPPTTQQPAAIQETVPVPREIERVEPVAVPVAASSKSQAQLEYEANMQIRFDGFAKKIKELEAQLETLSKKDQQAFVNSLRTAQGNRSVARTKLKQLRFIAPTQWTSVQADIERSMNDLEEAVLKVDGLMNPKP